MICIFRMFVAHSKSPDEAEFSHRVSFAHRDVPGLKYTLRSLNWDTAYGC